MAADSILPIPAESSSPPITSSSLQARQTKSRLACTNCRQSRARCDGIKPAPCSRCISRGTECYYEPNTKQVKGVLIQELDHMRVENVHLRSVNTSISQRLKLFEAENNDLRLILGAIANSDQSLVTLLPEIRKGLPVADLAQWLKTQPEIWNRASGPHPAQIYLQPHAGPVGQSRTSPGTSVPRIWTSVTQDADLLKHLIRLYCTWIHPVHPLFFEPAFRDGFRSADERTCTPALVNAICALGCTELEEFSESHKYHGIQEQKFSLRDAFIRVAVAELGKMTPGMPTYASALAVVALARMNIGDFRSATNMLAEAIDATNTPTPEPEDVQLATRKGIHTLTLLWHSFMDVDIPAQVSRDTLISLPYKQEYEIWAPYRNAADDTALAGVEGYVTLNAERQSLLADLIGGIGGFIRGVHGPITPEGLLSRYLALREWSAALPDVLSGGTELNLPHVAHLHLFYQTAMLLLLGGFVSHRLVIRRDAQHELQTLIMHHAREGTEILKRVESSGLCRYSPVLSIFCFYYICATIIRLDAQSPENVELAEYAVAAILRSAAAVDSSAFILQALCTAFLNNKYEIPHEAADFLMSKGMSLRTNGGEYNRQYPNSNQNLPIPDQEEQISRVARNLTREFNDQWEDAWQRFRGRLEQTRQPPSPKGKGKMVSLNDMLNN